ncbi:hypothetical protein DV736_g3056, partial [Chaetothyriales sp. CBS 134916]
MTKTFILPSVPGEPTVEVTIPSTLEPEQLLKFKAFEVWLKTLRQSFRLQSEKTHAFHRRRERYYLRSINVQSVDIFGGKRIGFIKMETVVRNETDDQPLPGIVFLRGGSVAILMILRPDDDENDERYVIMVQQPRIPAGSLAFYEIPAGMIDDAGTFAGAAANELREETGLTIPEHELRDLTKLALKDAKSSESHLQKAMYPSPGACDEYIALFFWERTMPRVELNELRDRISGTEREKITIKLVKYDELWREGARDAKTLAAWALYEGLRRDNRLDEDDDEEDGTG